MTCLLKISTSLTGQTISLCYRKPNQTKPNEMEIEWNSIQTGPSKLIETYLNRVLKWAAPVQLTPFCCTYLLRFTVRSVCFYRWFEAMRQICRNKSKRWSVMFLCLILVLLSQWECAGECFFFFSWCTLYSPSLLSPFLCIWLCAVVVFLVRLWHSLKVY